MKYIKMFSIIFLLGVLAGCAHAPGYRGSDLTTFVNGFGVVDPNNEKDLIAIAKKHFATHARAAIYVVGQVAIRHFSFSRNSSNGVKSMAVH